MNDLREDFKQDDLLRSMSVSNKLYNNILLRSPYLKLNDPEVQYCIKREIILLVPLV